MGRHEHRWETVPVTRNLKHGLVMVVCSDHPCGGVGWQLAVPVETIEQVEAYLDGTP